MLFADVRPIKKKMDEISAEEIEGADNAYERQRRAHNNRAENRMEKLGAVVDMIFLFVPHTVRDFAPPENIMFCQYEKMVNVGSDRPPKPKPGKRIVIYRQKADNGMRDYHKMKV